MRYVQDRKRVVAHRSAQFRGVAATPGAAPENPADLEPRPTLGLPQPATADQLPRGPLNDSRTGPPAQLAMAYEHSDLSPRRRPIERATDVTRHLGVGGDLRVVVQVILAPTAQLKPIRHQLGHPATIPDIDLSRHPDIGYLLSFGIAWAGRRLGCGIRLGARFIGCPSRVGERGSLMACVPAGCRGGAWLKKGLRALEVALPVLA
jgi:hypothetical protein